jgi:hypothetical protein
LRHQLARLLETPEPSIVGPSQRGAEVFVRKRSGKGSGDKLLASFRRLTETAFELFAGQRSL